MSTNAFNELHRAEIAADERAAAEQRAPLKRSAVDFLPHDNHLRFVQRVLESAATQEDRDAAAQMVRDMRRSLFTAHACIAQSHGASCVKNG